MEDKPLTVTRADLLKGGSDAHFREFLHAFMVFARRIEGVRDCLAKQIGVTAPQYEILSHLRESPHDASLTVSKIAERLHCSGPFATTEVGRLERLGLVSKRRDLKDARVVQVTITALCERRFRNVAPLQRRLNDALFESVGARDFQTLHRVFPKLVFDGDRAITLAGLLGISPEAQVATG